MKNLLAIIFLIFSVLNAYSQNILLQEIENMQREAEGPYSITQGECIDLGLSVKWASCNLGASSIEEYGDLYSWGEVETKKKYSKNKYWEKNRKYLQQKGIIDVYGNLTKEYDAASHKLGGKWRMPTAIEMEELIKKCTWFSRSFNGVNGYLVQGPNGNTIFLPITPEAVQDYLTTPSKCVYRTSTLAPRRIGITVNDAYCLEGKSINNFSNFLEGICIRPVQK